MTLRKIALLLAYAFAVGGVAAMAKRAPLASHLAQAGQVVLVLSLWRAACWYRTLAPTARVVAVKLSLAAVLSAGLALVPSTAGQPLGEAIGCWAAFFAVTFPVACGVVFFYRSSAWIKLARHGYQSG